MQPDLRPGRSSRRWISISRRRAEDIVIIAVGIGLALVTRLTLLGFKSVDFFNYTKDWYNTLKAGGFAAFGQSFANYNLPYLYLLYLEARFLPNLPVVVATKVPSLVTDFMSAWIMSGIVRARYPDGPFPLFAALAVLFAPTLVLNSAFWGQADSIYVCCLLAFLYFVLRRKEAAAMLLFGLALTFKAQAIFLAPLVLGLVLRHDIRLRYVLLVPLVMLLALVPALVAGRPLLDLLLIYPSQAGQYEQLTMHAPSMLAWFPDTGTFYPYFYPAGLVLAATASLALAFTIYKSREKLGPQLLVELALLSALIVPFFLPKMHERYFYLADVLSIAFAFYVPRYFLVPVLMILISFFAYQPTLFGAEPVSMGLLALGVFVLITAMSRHALSLLFPDSPDDQEMAAAVQ